MEIYPEKHEQLELTSNERSFLRTISRAFDEYENSYYVLHINPRRIDLGGGKPELFNLLVFDMGLLLFRFIEVEDVSIAKLTIESMAQKIVFNKIDKEIAIKHAGLCGRDMLTVVDKVVNKILTEDDINSPIVCGVGVDYGKTVITKIGIENVFDVKAFGDCINKASKYSKVSNSVKVSKKVKEHWPKGPNGKIVFKADEDGYLLTSK